MLGRNTVVLRDGDPGSHWCPIGKGFFVPEGEGIAVHPLQGDGQCSQHKATGHSPQRDKPFLGCVTDQQPALFRGRSEKHLDVNPTG